MGNTIDDPNEPSLLLQFFGKTGEFNLPSKGQGKTGEDNLPSKGQGKTGEFNLPSKGQGKTGEFNLPSKGQGKTGEDNSQFKGQGKTSYTNNYMLGGKNNITLKHTDFDEDFVPNKYDDDNIIFKFSQLNKKISFKEAEEKIKSDPNFKPELHLGQLKLFFCELLFLTKYIKNATKVLYVGAAEGYHIAKLADMFPDVMFDLWDPGRFKVEPRNNIKIYNQFFTIDSAKSYANREDKILFMCDIRTIAIAKLIKHGETTKVDNLVEEDMLMQAEWIKIINPLYAYLKFRLPWHTNKSSYLKGTIYLQPYSPSSTETRLMTNNYTDYVEYDNKDYDDKIAYFNFCIRYDNNILYDRWDDIFKKYKLLNCWDNAYGLYITDYYLRKIHNVTSDNEIGKLFMNIVNYHIKRYGKKYDIMFDIKK